MDQLAERVAERLDRSVARVLRDSTAAAEARPRCGYGGEGRLVEEDFVAEEAASKAQFGRSSPLTEARGGRHPGGRPANRAEGISSESASRLPLAAERKRNKKRLRRERLRLRSTGAGPPGWAGHPMLRQAPMIDVDGAVPDTGSGSINEGSDLDPGKILV
uniref:Uncharacterized protein n=1 Tax=Macrostomum lignano TaxID=282301 RepID=A0A1I8FHW9_9PLAT